MAKLRLKAVCADASGAILDVLKRAEKIGMEALRAHVEGTRKTAEAMGLQWEPDFICRGIADAIHSATATAEEIRSGRETRGPASVLKPFINS